MAHVILLRAPSLENGDDPYEKQFAAVGYQATSVPVLETAFTNLEELQWIIHSGPAFHGLTGVVITSGRAVDAWKQAVLNLVSGSVPRELQGQ